MTTFTQQEIEFLQKHGNEVSGFFCLFFIIFNFFVGSYFNKFRMVNFHCRKSYFFILYLDVLECTHLIMYSELMSAT